MWNWRTGRYDVYQLPNPPLHMSDPVACAPGVRPTPVGVDVGSALCPLPAGARLMGQSPTAMGSIARLGTGVPATYGGGAAAPGLGGFSAPPDVGLGGMGLGLGAIGDLVVVSVAAQLITPLVIAIFRGR